MGLSTSTPKPSKSAPSLAAVAAGMETFVADLLSGDRLAVDMAGPDGEMPFTGEDWAAYPTGQYRLDRLAHFGGPSPLDLPDA